MNHKLWFTTEMFAKAENIENVYTLTFAGICVEQQNSFSVCDSIISRYSMLIHRQSLKVSWGTIWDTTSPVQVVGSTSYRKRTLRKEGQQSQKNWFRTPTNQMFVFWTTPDDLAVNRPWSFCTQPQLHV